MAVEGPLQEFGETVLRLRDPDGFVVKLVGSYSNVVGLPLYESMTLLGGEGFPIRLGWLNGG